MTTVNYWTGNLDIPTDCVTELEQVAKLGDVNRWAPYGAFADEDDLFFPRPELQADDDQAPTADDAELLCPIDAALEETQLINAMSLDCETAFDLSPLQPRADTASTATATATPPPPPATEVPPPPPPPLHEELRVGVDASEPPPSPPCEWRTLDCGDSDAGAAGEAEAIDVDDDDAADDDTADDDVDDDIDNDTGAAAAGPEDMSPAALNKMMGFFDDLKSIRKLIDSMERRSVTFVEERMHVSIPRSKLSHVGLRQQKENAKAKLSALDGGVAKKKKTRRLAPRRNIKICSKCTRDRKKCVVTPDNGGKCERCVLLFSSCSFEA